MKNMMAIAAMAALMSGCVLAPDRRGGYGDADADVHGSRERMEYPQRSRAISERVGRMLTDPDFENFYAIAVERAAKRGHRRPTVVIKEIEDNTRAGVSDSRTTGQIHRELKTALRKTRKFAVIDIHERLRSADVGSDEVDGGARADNGQNFGEYEAGDFHLFGEIAAENVSGRVYFHFLNLRMVDPVTGDEIWSDTVRMRKE